MLYYGQSEARSAHLSAPCLVHSIKALKYALQMVSGYAAPFVHNFYNHFFVCFISSNNNRLVRLTVFDRVIHEIDDGLLEECCIDLRNNRVVSLALQICVLQLRSLS